MKNINKILSLFAISALLFTTSCSEDDHTGGSQINYSNTTVTLSTAANDVVVDESSIDPDALPSFTVTASISEAVLVDLHIPLTQVGGTANSDDFSAGTIVIPSGFTSASAKVTVMKTGNVEGDETLMIGAANNIANATVSDFTLNISIDSDYINDVLNLELNWDGEVEFEDDNSSGVYNFCGMDFDMLIYDAAFVDTGIYDAASAACPEHVDLDGSLADGEYILVVDLYDNPYSALALGADVPVNLNFEQEYFDTNGTITLPGYTTDSNGGTFPIATVTKSGYNYTVTPY